ncbi:unnamed protein product [Dimorphilus gyrociliatus]|uniref:Uncharacterized protein n=1 Tax=Dimorphilus gyrociliatus TaxID=2664684 RepID=A0A7I8W601_9ANNE|nr:unnamed protein product [Dimorphilus gyrociliatus]
MKYGGPLGCEINDKITNKTVRFDAIPHVRNFHTFGPLKRVSGKSNPLYSMNMGVRNFGKSFRQFKNVSYEFRSDGFAEVDKLEEVEELIPTVSNYNITTGELTTVTDAPRNVTVQWNIRAFNRLEKDLLYRIHSSPKYVYKENEALDINNIQMDHDYPILTCILVTCSMILFSFVLCKLFVFKCVRGFLRNMFFKEYN